MGDAAVRGAAIAQLGGCLTGQKAGAKTNEEYVELPICRSHEGVHLANYEILLNVTVF